MPLKSDLSEEAIWGPQNILITLAILLCYYHNYPFAPDVLIRNSPLAPRGVKPTWVGGMLKLGKGTSQLLPYALWSGKYRRMQLSLSLSLPPLSFSDISVIQSTATPLPPSSHSCISLSFSHRLRPLHPSVLYLAFYLTISCPLLFPLFSPTST